MRRLIVTADDVGLHQGMTVGAIRAHQHGIVTACSVAGAGRELAHAVDELAKCPDLDVGVHLMLVESRPVSDPARVPTLVTKTGAFPAGYPAFAARYAARQVSMADVEIELRAQIERVLATGLPVRHMNGHQHLHVLPRIFDVVVQLALDYRIPYVRIPDDRGPTGTLSMRRSGVAALGLLARKAARVARRAGLLINTCSIGVADAGHLTAERIRRLLPQVEDLTELVTHPGVGGPTMAGHHGWQYDWDAEADALCDPALVDALDREQIQLVNVRDACAAEWAPEIPRRA